jgi:hypothetical protein
MAHDFVSETGIKNMALSHIGSKALIESGTENSVGTVQTGLWYDYSRLRVLKAHDWGFARRRRTLALHGDTISEVSSDPLAGVWGFRYQYPDDCVASRKIQNPTAPPDDAIPFDIEGSLDGGEKSILTDQEDAVLVYTWDLHATALFSSSFTIVLSHLLAHHIAFAVTGKRRIAREELATYLTLLPGAMADDANEQMDTPPREAEWIRGRT